MNNPFLSNVTTVFVEFEGFWVDKNNNDILFPNQPDICDIIGTVFNIGELPLELVLLFAFVIV